MKKLLKSYQISQFQGFKTKENIEFIKQVQCL